MTVEYVTRRLAAGLLVGLLLCIAALPSVYAADSDTSSNKESITLSPVSRQYQLKAGQKQTDELTVINDGDVAYDFTVYAQPYSVNDEDYDPDFFNERDNTDVHKWIKAEKSTYHLAAGESTKVRFTITVPKDTKPGGHYGVIFAETQPASKAEGNSVARKKRVGTLLYATVDGEYRIGGSLKSLSIPMLQLKTPLVTETKVANTGNTDFKVDLSMEVKDLFGSVKHTDAKAYQVLPQTTRKMSLEWANAPSFGLFKVSVTTKFLDETITKNAYVLMAPLEAYLVLIVALFAAVIYFVQKRR